MNQRAIKARIVKERLEFTEVAEKVNYEIDKDKSYHK